MNPQTFLTINIDSLLRNLDRLIDIRPRGDAQAREERIFTSAEISETFDDIAKRRWLSRLTVPGQSHDDFMFYWDKLGEMVYRMQEDPDGCNENWGMDRRELVKIEDLLGEVR